MKNINNINTIIVICVGFMNTSKLKHVQDTEICPVTYDIALRASRRSSLDLSQGNERESQWHRCLYHPGTAYPLWPLEAGIVLHQE